MKQKHSVSIMWFRQDLRLHDNLAWQEVCQAQVPVVAIFILPEHKIATEGFGEASCWWLHHSLSTLEAQLKQKKISLLYYKGKEDAVFKELIQTYHVKNIFWNRLYDPKAIKRDTDLKNYFKSENINVKSFNASLLAEPWDIKSQKETAYKVFTPFWKNLCQNMTKEFDLDTIKSTPIGLSVETNLKLQDLNLLPKLKWDDGFYKKWQPGEAHALKQLDKFMEDTLQNYEDGRDYPYDSGTSLLSPHLHFGEISPRLIWNKMYEKSLLMQDSQDKKAVDKYMSEIGWREFAYHLMYHFPNTLEQPLQEKFKAFPWHNDKENFRKWCKGMTGIPIVDAGMRELWHTGWMHNRVRMIVSSFLTKNLLIDWRWGARWFMDTLVDADMASNTLGWQWTAGCGADAAPYYRIFNPILQSEKFDAEGNYIRLWIPELKNLPSKWIHKPSEMPQSLCQELKFEIGKNYPRPMVDLGETRRRALSIFEELGKV